MNKIFLTLAIVCVTAISKAENISHQLSALLEQNKKLLALAQQQQLQIDELRARLDGLDEAGQRQDLEINEIREEAVLASEYAQTQPTPGSRFTLSGEAGIAFFAGESNTEFANEEFRIGESRLLLEAEVARNAYLFATVELFRRESGNSDVEVGEVFVDIEDFLGLDSLLTARAGRFQIPFGQEYLNRYVFENPLVSHSVADIMGIDEGIEIFGKADAFSYTLAVMNGGKSALRDFDSGKAIVARFGYQPAENTIFHASFMDTGDINVAGDGSAELWIGDTRFRSIGSAETREFDVTLGQLDGSYEWNGGAVKAALGAARYKDDDPLGSNSRDLDFFQIEALKNLSSEIYGVLRYSELEVDGGYPIAGNGNPAKFVYSGILTEELKRLSLGLGYTPVESMIAKLEYSFEEGKHSDGAKRKDTNQLSAELGVRF